MALLPPSRPFAGRFWGLALLGSWRPPPAPWWPWPAAPTITVGTPAGLYALTPSGAVAIIAGVVVAVQGGLDGTAALLGDGAVWAHAVGGRPSYPGGAPPPSGAHSGCIALTALASTCPAASVMPWVNERPPINEKINETINAPRSDVLGPGALAPRSYMP